VGSCTLTYGLAIAIIWWFSSDVLVITVLVLAAIVAALVSFALGVAARKALLPLFQASRSLAEGKLEYRITGPDNNIPAELAAVADGFNVMADRLEASQSNLREINLHLEQLVSERSRDIVTLNQQLQLREACFTRCFEALNLGVVVFVGQRVHYANKVFAELVGVPLDEIKGRPENELLKSLSYKALNKPRRAPSEDAPVRFEIEHNVNGDTTFWNAQQIPLSGESKSGSIVVLQNITAETRKTKAYAQLFSILSHELRTPLTSIKGGATTLLRTDVDWEKDFERQCLEDISEESDRLRRLVENVMDLSRILDGSLKLNPERFCLADLLRRTIQGVQRAYPEFSFELQESGETGEMTADPDRIKQVVLNILHNATKHSLKGMKVTVILDNRPTEVQITIKDNGPGIPGPQIKNIFEPFHGGRTKSGDLGIGLGLAIAKGIVEAHKGRIWAESLERQGASFHIILPLDIRRDVSEEDQKPLNSMLPGLFYG